MTTQSHKERYICKAEEYREPNQPKDTWSYALCKVYEVNPETGVETYLGEYLRNYRALYDTFVPFEQDGKHYALISRKYVGTAVMELPSCKIIAEEEYTSHGFCPTGFYVPEFYGHGTKPLHEEVKGKFGFVCGCVWADDSSWKIQFLDLRDITKGIIRRDDRFGYVELIDDLKLEDSIEVDYVDPEDFEIDIYIKIVKRWCGKINKDENDNA